MTIIRRSFKHNHETILNSSINLFELWLLNHAQQYHKHKCLKQAEYFYASQILIYFVSTVRKLFAALLLTICLFSFVGYRIVFNVLENNAEKQLISKLDVNNYNDESLVTIVIPVHIPYLVNWSSFRRIDGEVSINGKVYRYVKEKVFDGKLILKCLPDYQKMKLQAAKNNFFRDQNDTVGKSPQKSGNNYLKVFSGDYENLEISSSIDLQRILSKNTISRGAYSLQKGEILIPEKPPCLIN